MRGFRRRSAFGKKVLSEKKCLWWESAFERTDLHFILRNEAMKKRVAHTSFLVG